MEKVVDLLNQGWFGAILGILGLVFGLYQIRKRTDPQLVYQHWSQLLITGHIGLLPDEVSVSYQGRKVPRVSLSHVVIWNSGGAAMREGDIVHEDPPRFVFPEGDEILKAEVIKRTRPAIDFKLNLDPTQPNIATFGFSFLDRNDGALLRILHTASPPEPTSHGTVVGMPRGIEYGGKITLRYGVMPLWMLRANFVGMALAGGFALALSFPQVPKILGLSIDRPPSILILIIGGGLYLFLALMGLYLTRRKYPAKLTPDEVIEANKFDVRQVVGAVLNSFFK